MNNQQAEQLKKIMMADSYFAQPITPPFPQPLAIKSLQQTLNIKDTEGLVQFIIASPKRFNESEKNDHDTAERYTNCLNLYYVESSFSIEKRR
ncbi:Uncharacterised protein [Proteus mirabilis]|uniref:Uncharacterized protein n=1 Tax=Proteus mirabilis TaxID=584 RepID=A0A2X2DRZ4_PROMI|nr:Uncharacterised protein [Proteus mirabilis]